MSRSTRRASLTALAATALAVPLSLGLIPGVSASEPAPTAVVATPAASSNANTFLPTGSMHVRRAGATATALPDGDVLVAGGGTAGAELYHPRSGTWSVTGTMSTARTNATATLLSDGDVLVAGGCCDPTNPNRGLASAELYDPASGSWSLTGSMNTPRSGDTATLLGDGKVLVAGGACNGTAYGCDAGSFLYNLRSAELYDPSTGTWSATGSMDAGREFQTATLLPNGFVLVAGGFESCDDDFCTDLNSAQLYDPVTGTWLHTGSMHVGRESQTATLLTDGEVLVAGGLNEGGGSGFQATYASAELYNPTFGTWSTTASMNHARSGQTATLLNGGWVLVTGGGTSSSEIYEPGPAVWVPTGSLSTARTDQTATLLGNGDVLVAGGTEPGVGSPLATAEVYEAGVGPLVKLSAETLALPTQEVGTTGNAQSFTVSNYGTAPLHVAGVETSGTDPADFAAASACRAQPVAPGTSCTVLVRFSPLHQGLLTATVGVVDDATLSPQGVAVSGNAAGPDVWVPTGSMSAPRTDFSATTLSDGRVLMAGGENMGVSVTTAELYDPATGSFVPTGSLNVPRTFPATVRLPNGSVLAAGGLMTNGTQPTVLSSAEIYDPAEGKWSLTTPMNVASDGLTASLLVNGLVLVTGFFGSTPELYDPSSATWTDTGALPTPGQSGLVATLHSGQVLMAGVPNGASALYDPATNTWSATGSLGTARYAGSATVLSDGDVLAVGGLPGNGGNALSSAELYHPASGTWTATDPLPAPRYDQSAVLLPNGTVLLAGGCTTICQSGPDQNATYLYANGFWSQTGSLPFARIGQQASVLPDGDVLLAGGDISGGFAATTTAELYIPTLISARPPQAAAGQQITLTGNGFYAHEQVVVTLNGRVLARPDADVRGQLAVAVTVPAVTPGTYSLDAQGETSFAFAASTFVVTASPGTPAPLP